MTEEFIDDGGSLDADLDQAPTYRIDHQRPFVTGAAAYLSQPGYTGIVPLPAQKKASPPKGTTGGTGVDLSAADIYAITEAPESPDVVRRIKWMNRFANIGWRFPSWLLGIDVDSDPKGDKVKSGADEIAALETILGPLPPTYYSSNRGPDSRSRHLLYRKPGVVFLDEHTKGDDGHELLPSVEFIQREYRYLVVWPSLHPSGRPYVWYAPDGTPLDGPPPLHLVPVLPDAWIERFTAEFAEAAAVSDTEATAMLQGFLADGMCTATANTLAKHLEILRGPAAARQPSARNGVMALLRVGEMGHHGVPEALEALAEEYINLVTVGDDARSLPVANGEFHRMVHGKRGLGLIKAAPTTTENTGCKCLTHEVLPEPVEQDLFEAFLNTFDSPGSTRMADNREAWLIEAIRTKPDPLRAWQHHARKAFADAIQGRYPARTATRFLDRNCPAPADDHNLHLRVALAAALATLEGVTS